MKRKELNASTLRSVLFISIVAIIAITGAGFGFAHSKLMDYAKEISKSKVDAGASTGTVSSLQQAKEQLDAAEEVKNKIALLRATDSLPEFRIVSEVQKIAKKNNITISSFSYTTAESSSEGTTSTQSSQAPTTTPASPQPVAVDTSAPATPAPQKSIVLNVTLGTISNYADYLQFIYDIEQNLPKMKISGVGVEPNGDGEGITADPLVIEMYVN